VREAAVLVSPSIQAVLRFCLNNLRGCSTGIIDYEIRLEMISCGMICIPGFMKMVQAFKHDYGFASAA
jgi:hypothetical protein